MDLSKLPRLSKTEPPAGGPDPAAPPSTPGGPPAAGQPVRRGTFCDQCGANLRPGARFCDGCGTPVVAPAAAAASAVVPAYQAPPDDDPVAAGGPEAWISIALGVLLMFLSPRIWQYLFSPGTFSTKWSFTDPAGQPLAYTKTVFFWGDVTLTGFALALILEGAVLIFSRRPLVVLVALVVTVTATVANLVYLVYLVRMFNDYGLQMLSAIAVIFGTFMAAYQWRLLTALAAAQRQARR